MHALRLLAARALQVGGTGGLSGRACPAVHARLQDALRRCTRPLPCLACMPRTHFALSPPLLLPRPTTLALPHTLSLNPLSPPPRGAPPAPQEVDAGHLPRWARLRVATPAV